MIKTKITPAIYLRLINTNKCFIVYDVNNDNKITSYMITDDLKRYYNKKFQHFKLIEVIKRDVNNNLKF